MRLSLHIPIMLQLFFLLVAGGLVFSAKASAQVYCVEKAGAKLYAKPDDKTKPVWRAPLYTPLMGTGNRINHLVEVADMDSKKYWINKKHLNGRISCLVVRVKKTNLRTGPGLSYKTAKNNKAEKYESFIDLGGEDGWTQIQDESGQKAWVNLDQVWKPTNRMRLSFDEGK